MEYDVTTDDLAYMSATAALERFASRVSGVITNETELG